MKLRVGCEFQYESTWPTPSVMLVQPHPDAPHGVVREEWRADPAMETRAYADVFGNRCLRFTIPAGATTLSYDAVVEVSGAPDEVSPDATQAPVEELPDEVLAHTLPSRYCLSDKLMGAAWELFGDAPLGWGRVQAVCDWIHENIEYGVLTTPLTDAVEVYEQRGGMCRDFAHLGVTFCRALNIPARYVFGYLPDIGVPPQERPMDFHAWFEAFLDGRWWTLDARFNTPRRGRVVIGRGRDAVDVAMMTTYGPAQFRRMTVWSDLAEDGDDPTRPAETAQGEFQGDTGQALVLDLGHTSP